MTNTTTVIIENFDVTNSMGFTQWYYLITFLLFMGLTLWVIYDLIKRLEIKDYYCKNKHLYFISALFIWAGLFVIGMINAGVVEFLVFTNFAHFLLGLNVLFYLVNIILNFGHFSKDKTVSYSNSNNYLRRF